MREQDLRNQINLAQSLSRIQPESLASREATARVFQKIHEKKESIENAEWDYLKAAEQILLHPAMEILAERGLITLAAIKPRAFEGKFNLNPRLPVAFKDDEAARIVRREIMREGPSWKGYGKILLDISIQLRPEQVREFYPDLVKKAYWNGIESHMASSPVTYLLLQHVVRNRNGEEIPQPDAVKWWRERMGATNPEEAKPSSIRRKFARAISNNIVHGSDSPESVIREMNLIGNILHKDLNDYALERMHGRRSRRERIKLQDPPELLIAGK